MLVGEIGIPHDTFLYSLKHWNIACIIRGYRRSQHPLWESSRLNAFFTMSAFANLKESGIRNDRDLITFPWEKEVVTRKKPNEDEVAEMQALLKEMNKGVIHKNTGFFSG